MLFRAFFLSLLFVSLASLAQEPTCVQRLTSLASSGLPLEAVLKSAQVKTVIVPLPRGDLPLEFLLMSEVYDPTAYSGGRNLLQTVFATLSAPRSILVMGTGSGYEAIGLALRYPHLHVDAVDISARAVLNTDLNADFHQVADRVKVWQSDLFRQVTARYDAIIFHAPRPIEESYGAVNRKIHDSKFFDLGGGIREKIINEFSAHLQAQGSLFLLTEADFQPVTKSSFRRVLTAPWSPRALDEGNYGVFEFKDSPFSP